MDTDDRSKPSGKVSRRQFVAGIGLAGAALLAGGARSGSEAAPVPKKWDMETDVVVVGFGGAGACAAIEAAKAGSSVVILEKLLFPVAQQPSPAASCWLPVPRCRRARA